MVVTMVVRWWSDGQPKIGLRDAEERVPAPHRCLSRESPLRSCISSHALLVVTLRRRAHTESAVPIKPRSNGPYAFKSLAHAEQRGRKRRTQR